MKFETKNITIIEEVETKEAKELKTKLQKKYCALYIVPLSIFIISFILFFYEHFLTSHSTFDNTLYTISITIMILSIIVLIINLIVYIKYMKPINKLYKTAEFNDKIRHEERIRYKERIRLQNHEEQKIFSTKDIKKTLK